MLFALSPGVLSHYPSRCCLLSLVVLSLFGLDVESHAQAPTNVAQGGIATASSTWSASYNAAQAVDGNTATGWSSSATDTSAFVQVDLGQAYPLSQVQVVTRQDYDQPATRQNFAVWASNNADMSVGHVVLGSQGATSLPYQGTWSAVVSDPTPYRYVAFVKTDGGYSFVTELRAFTPAVPLGLAASTSYSFVSLTWQPFTGATNYNIYRTGSPQTAPTVIQGSASNTTIDSSITLGQTYYYQVSAITSTGETGLSTQVSVTPTGRLSPVVKMTAPTSGITATTGTSILLAATAVPRSGTVSKVAFYVAPAQYDSGGNPILTTGTLIGTATIAPYQTSWNNVPSGDFFLTAVATDSLGDAATSLPLPVSVLSTPIGTALTAAQAIQIAQTFCSATNTPISAGTPTTANATSSSPTYNGVVWQVGFAGTASVEIADASGVVVSYFNYTLANQLDANSQPPGTPITQAQAQTIANAVLLASHQSSAELANQQFAQNNILSPASYAGDLWTVRWNRVAGGALYRRDQATLLLQAETGAVEAWKLTFQAPALAAVGSTVSQAQAQAIAQNTMDAEGNNLGLSGQVFQTAQQVIVQPNTLWPPSGSTSPGSAQPIPGSASRIVWDCLFSNAPTSGSLTSSSLSGSTSSEVWVDAATAQVIGGSKWQVKARHSSQRKHLKPLVPMAKPNLKRDVPFDGMRKQL